MPTAQPQPLSRKKKILFLSALYALMVVAAVLVLGLTSIGLRATRLYKFYKSQTNRVYGRVFRYDPELGSGPIPGAQGKWAYPGVPEIPIRIDQHGFRVPANGMEADAGGRPFLLTLGCSFSFGASIPAEKAYPYLVAQQLSARCLNAAFPGYGLAQMLLQGQRLIPEYKPELVLVQFSPWLIERSQDPFAFSYLAKSTSPFFYNDHGRLAIHPPVFRPAMADLDFTRYRDSQAGARDYLAFMVRAGFPLFLSDGTDMAVYYAKRLLGMFPRPEQNSARIVDQVYQELGRLCAENGSRMVIVILTDPGTSRKPAPAELEHLAAVPQAILVNTEPALLAALPVRSREAYDLAYEYYPGHPPIYLDGHPNEAAHRIIAEQILNAIRSRTGRPEP